MTEIAPNSTEDDPLARWEQDQAEGYNQGLTPLHPPQKALIRINVAISMLVLLAVACAGELVLYDRFPGFSGAIIGPIAVVALFLLVFLPQRIYRRWGYAMDCAGAEEQLRVLRGFLWRTDTIVPFNRIQHIDVAQGPLQRYFGLSTLIVHTAGTHNSIVALPGLSTPDAEAMRETIKGHIRQDMI